MRLKNKIRSQGTSYFTAPAIKVASTSRFGKYQP
jgi:hypothetical protein